MRGMCDSHLTTWQTQQTAIMFLSVWTVISDIQDRQDGLARGIPWHEQAMSLKTPLWLTTPFAGLFSFFCRQTDIIDRYKGWAMEWNPVYVCG